MNTEMNAAELERLERQRDEAVAVAVSHRMCSLNGLRESTPPQNRQLILHHYYLKR